MKSFRITPNNRLVANYIDSYWFLEKAEGEQAHTQPKLNPDPCAHLIIAPQHQRYHYSQGERVQVGEGSHWIYPYVNTYRMDHAQAFRVIGIKFKPGALYSLGLGQQPMPLDTIEPVLLANIVDSCEHDLLNTSGDAAKLGAQLDALLSFLINDVQPDRHAVITAGALALLNDYPIARLGEQLNCSQRTLERSFLKTTGLTLKQYKLMVRLEEILNYLYKLGEQPIDWADVAHRFGFSDQPHLIRYLKRFIGDTPTQYGENRDLAIDVYGDFDIR